MLTGWFRSNKFYLIIGKIKFMVSSQRKSSNEIELSIGEHKTGACGFF